VIAGSSFTITVTALDASNNLGVGYTGTVHFSSSDVQAGLPSDYTFLSTDKGVQTFSITLKTAGSQVLSIADTADSYISATANVTVARAAASTLALSGFASPTTAGMAGSLTVTAEDAYSNVATGYSGTVEFTSSDSQAVLPSNYTFTSGDAGVHNFT